MTVPLGQLRPFDRLKLAIVAMSIGGLALLFVLRAVDLWQGRGDRLEAGSAHAENLTHILSEYVRGALAATDAALRQLQDHDRRVGGAQASEEAWQSILESTKAALTAAGSVSIVDADGVIRHSTQPLIVGESRRTLFVFQRLAAGTRDEFVVGAPLPTVTEPTRLILPVARRLERADGAFDGVVVVVFEPGELRSFFKSVDVGHDGVISVLHPNGTVLFREPSTADPIGQFMPSDPILVAARLKPAGLLDHQLATNHAATITAYQTLSAPPLVVAVSLSEAELLAAWWREVFDSILAFGVLSLIVAGAAIVLGRQVDARVVAEQALSETEERTRFALDAVRVGTWEVDLTSGTARWSETLQALHGLSPGTFGDTLEAFVDLIHPDDRADVQRTIEQAARDHTDAQLVYRTSWPDGTIHWINGVGRTFYSEEGVAVRAVGVGMDITDRHVLEDQFRQAQKMEAVGQLAGGVAHDFNNLLTAILGFAELLADGYQPGDPALDDLAEIRKAAERATALTRQLLAFSRRQILQPTALDLNAVLTNAVQMLRRLIAEDIDLQLRLSPDLRRVIADPIQLEQVLMNLVVNARDAMPEGGTLTIETTNVLLDAAYARRHGITAAVTGPFALLQVSDSGVGMDRETQKRIFEPFFTTKSPGKGTGLGLATVYGIIKQSGGFVWVYSEVGAGTTFKVYLPSIEAPSHAHAGAPVISATAPRGTETVLLVEDEESVRRLGRTLLERCGYRVLTAPDPATAETVAAAEAGPIALLVTDVVMPGASGPELFDRLYRARPAMKVLYMSGYADEAIVHRGVLDSGVAFLQKPFSALALTRKVREVLES